jgi:hypothetical protein
MAIIGGTHARETLIGTGAIDAIAGLGGSDLIDGLGGSDTISGGDGADSLQGGDGSDVVYGHSDADLDPASGNITATLLADVGSGAVFVTGAPGDDGFVYALRKDVGDIVRINTTTGAQSTFLDTPTKASPTLRRSKRSSPFRIRPLPTTMADRWSSGRTATSTSQSVTAAVPMTPTAAPRTSIPCWARCSGST